MRRSYEQPSRRMGVYHSLLVMALIALIVFIVGLQLGTANGRRLATEEASVDLERAQSNLTQLWVEHKALTDKHRSLQYRYTMRGLQPLKGDTHAPEKR